MKIIKYSVMALALAAAGSAQAFGIGVRAGTTGLGADVAWSIAPTLSARLGYSGGKVGYDVDTDQVSYDGDLKLSNVNALIDFAPLGPLFRISGGLVFNDNKLDVRGNLGAGSLTGTVKSGRSAAPYLGIGYGRVSGAGVNFYADLGVMFQGSPRASLNANCAGLSAGQCSTLQGQVAAEEARLQDEVKNFKYYPVLNIGLTIGF
jgi:hypothetical protein